MYGYLILSLLIPIKCDWNAWTETCFQLIINILYSGCGGSFIQVVRSYYAAQLTLCVSVCVCVCHLLLFSRQLLYKFRILFCVKCLRLGNTYRECSVFTIALNPPLSTVWVGIMSLHTCTDLVCCVLAPLAVGHWLLHDSEMMPALSFCLSTPSLELFMPEPWDILKQPFILVEMFSRGLLLPRTISLVFHTFQCMEMYICFNLEVKCMVTVYHIVTCSQCGNKNPLHTQTRVKLNPVSLGILSMLEN